MSGYYFDDDDEDDDLEWEREEREREERAKLAETLPVMHRANDLLDLAKLVAETWADEPLESRWGGTLPYHVAKIKECIVEPEMDNHYSQRVEWAVCVKQAVLDMTGYIRFCGKSARQTSTT